MTDVEKQDYIDAELCLQSAETKESFNGTKNRWDELTYVHLIQTSYVHAVVSISCLSSPTWPMLMHLEGCFPPLAPPLRASP